MRLSSDGLRATGGSEGEKRCIKKLIGAKTGKFGQKDEVRTVGRCTSLKLKRRASNKFVVTKRLTGQIFTGVAAVRNHQDTFFHQRCPGRPQRW
jgi:hypothetical protein